MHRFERLSGPGHAGAAVRHWHSGSSELIALDVDDLNLSAGVLRCASKGKGRVIPYIKRRCGL